MSVWGICIFLKPRKKTTGKSGCDVKKSKNEPPDLAVHF